MNIFIQNTENHFRKMLSVQKFTCTHVRTEIDFLNRKFIALGRI